MDTPLPISSSLSLLTDPSAIKQPQSLIAQAVLLAGDGKVWTRETRQMRLLPELGKECTFGVVEDLWINIVYGMMIDYFKAAGLSPRMLRLRQ